MNTRLATILGYLLVLGSGIALQILAVRRPERFPSLGRVFTHVMRTRTGRVGVCVFWGWIGLHFFAK
jgi:Family of unknown function (DUF6186)